MRLFSLKFSLVFVVVFFFGGYGVDFLMDADCGGSGLAIGLGLLLNVDGLWWRQLTGVAEKKVVEREKSFVIFFIC